MQILPISLFLLVSFCSILKSKGFIGQSSKFSRLASLMLPQLGRGERHELQNKAYDGVDWPRAAGGANLCRGQG
jgi:hypothetical protein